MKKCVAMLVALLSVCLTVGAFAEVVGVTGQGTMGAPYHQLTRLFIEYSEEVDNPGVDAYQVVDFGVAAMKEEYESRPYDVGVITDVYTNDTAAVREDKTSVPGKFVIVEMAGTDGSYYDEAEQMWKPKNITGIATTRFAGEKKNHTRTDWSMLTIAQTKDVVNANGEVVQKKAILPSLPSEPIYTPEIAEAFTQMTIPASNGKYDILFNLHLPENYDATKKYPLMISQNGGGGGMTTAQTLEDGSYACLGADITIDAVPIAFVRANPELIVVSFQRWDVCPEEWEVDNVNSLIELNEYLRANYAVDPERVYAIGSSQGTAITSCAIRRRPDLWSGYAQCNGSFMLEDEKNRFTLYKDEFMVSLVGHTDDQLWEICNNPDNRLDQAIIDETGKCFDGVIEHRIPIYFFSGVNDQAGPSLNTTSAYLYLKERYAAMGLSEDEINELVAISVVNDEQFHERGVCEYHASSKIAVTEGFPVIEWILSR